MDKMQKRHIDNNFYRVSINEAKKLADGVLPKPGYCKIVKRPDWIHPTKTLKYKNFEETVRCSLCELHRTPVNGKTVWAIMPIYRKDE